MDGGCPGSGVGSGLPLHGPVSVRCDFGLTPPDPHQRPHRRAAGSYLILHITRAAPPQTTQQGWHLHFQVRAQCWQCTKASGIAGLGTAG